MSQTKTKKKDKSWVFILLLLTGVVFVFFSQGESHKKMGEKRDPVTIGRVNSHLKDTAYNVESDRRQRQIEVYQELNKLKDSSAQAPYRESKDFTLESDPYMQSLTAELNRSQGPVPYQTPEQIVQERLYENEQLRKASDAYRESYAAQFIENARRGGWDIELGPNFEVLSVKKINEKRHPSLFEQDHDSNSGAGR